MDLSRKFRVTGVPKTIVNGSIEILGALPEDQFVRTVVGAPDGDADSTQ
jgi:predicted DsbA family dithiol-disulfide isomerase